MEDAAINSSLTEYLSEYSGLNLFFRLQHLIQGEIASKGEIKGITKFCIEKEKDGPFYIQVENCQKIIGQMVPENQYSGEKAAFASQEAEFRKQLNNALRINAKQKILENYSALAALNESIGDLNQSLINIRRAKEHVLLASSLNMIGSLKKMQFFTFLSEELGVLPIISHEVYNQKDSDQVKLKGFERAHFICFILAMNHMNFSRANEYIKHLDFKFDEVITEYSSKRDISYYTILLLLVSSGLRNIKDKLKIPIYKKLASLSKEGKELVTMITQNEFKKARVIYLNIADYLRRDPYIGSNMYVYDRKIRTSFFRMYLAAFSRAKISVVADVLRINQDDISQILENEIRAGNLDIKIDQDNACVIKNVDHHSTYMAVLDRAVKMMNNKNSAFITNLLSNKIEQEMLGNVADSVMDMFN